MPCRFAFAPLNKFSMKWQFKTTGSLLLASEFTCLLQ
jgi:hypothetical protein